jgi:hypothetical protein
MEIKLEEKKQTYRSALDIRKERVVFVLAIFSVAVVEPGGAPKRIFVRGFYKK